CRGEQVLILVVVIEPGQVGDKPPFFFGSASGDPGSGIECPYIVIREIGSVKRCSGDGFMLKRESQQGVERMGASEGSPVGKEVFVQPVERAASYIIGGGNGGRELHQVAHG